jgi:hypothetical protein
MLEIRLRAYVPSLLSKLASQLVQDVPQEDALCEFDCRKRQCLAGEWESCPRRLNYLKTRSRSKNGRVGKLSTKTKLSQNPLTLGKLGLLGICRAQSRRIQSCKRRQELMRTRIKN